MRDRGVDVADTKSSPTDVVTEADQACEELIRERLLGARPDDGFVGEEGDDVARHLRRPLDRRPDRRHRQLPLRPAALRRLHRRRARRTRSWPGWCSAPRSRLEYAATRGGGATCNGVPLQVRATPPLEQALVATGFSYETDDPRPPGRGGRPDAAAGPRHPPAGSCALDLCAVAAGQLRRLRRGGRRTSGTTPPADWSRAEAGATVRGLDRRPRGQDLVVCAPTPGWADFAALVRACGFLGNDAA